MEFDFGLPCGPYACTPPMCANPMLDCVRLARRTYACVFDGFCCFRPWQGPSWSPPGALLSIPLGRSWRLPWGLPGGFPGVLLPPPGCPCGALLGSPGALLAALQNTPKTTIHSSFFMVWGSCGAALESLLGRSLGGSGRLSWGPPGVPPGAPLGGPPGALWPPLGALPGQASGGC